MENSLMMLQQGLFHGLLNYEELTAQLKITLEKYKGYTVLEETEEGDKATLEELKKVRTPIKALRASLNKELEKKTKEELGKVDTLIKLLDEPIKSIESGLDVFTDKKRLERRERKLNKFTPLITECNQILGEIEIPWFTIPQIEFREDWFNKRDDDTSRLIDEETARIKATIQNAQSRLEVAKMYAKQIEESYCLKVEISLDMIGSNIYTYDIAKLKEAIEKLGEKQVLTEKKVEEELERRATFEAEKKVKEEIETIKVVDEIKVVEIPKKSEVIIVEKERIFRISLKTKSGGNVCKLIENVLKDNIDIIDIKIIEVV